MTRDNNTLQFNLPEFFLDDNSLSQDVDRAHQHITRLNAQRYGLRLEELFSEIPELTRISFSLSDDNFLYGAEHNGEDDPDLEHIQSNIDSYLEGINTVREEGLTSFITTLFNHSDDFTPDNVSDRISAAYALIWSTEPTLSWTEFKAKRLAIQQAQSLDHNTPTSTPSISKKRL